MAAQFYKVPVDLLQELSERRWSKENPAPEVVAYLYARQALWSGQGISIRALAEYSGRSRRQANRILISATYEHDRDRAGHKRDKAGHKRDKAGQQKLAIPVTSEPVWATTVTERATSVTERATSGPLRARAISDPDPDQIIDPIKNGPSRPRVDWDALWSKMMEPYTATGRRVVSWKAWGDQVKAGVKRHGQEPFLKAWRYLLTSGREEFYLEARKDSQLIETFLRPGNLKAFVAKAIDWDPATGVNGYDPAKQDLKRKARAWVAEHPAHPSITTVAEAMKQRPWEKHDGHL